MPSFYSVHGDLSQKTFDAYGVCGSCPRSIEERRNFYLTYLEDVVPYEVVVLHVPNDLQLYDLGGGAHDREEIQLWYEGKIFVTCVICLDNHLTGPEETAGTLASTYWRYGQLVHNPHQAWGTFTGLSQIRFCSSEDGRAWVRTATFHPINQARDVVDYFRQEFERVRR